MPKEGGLECVIIKITGVLIILLVDLEPQLYRPYVVYENRKKTFYVEVLKALYGMLIPTFLWYKSLNLILRKRDLF